MSFAWRSACSRFERVLIKTLLRGSCLRSTEPEHPTCRTLVQLYSHSAPTWKRDPLHQAPLYLDTVQRSENRTVTRERLRVSISRIWYFPPEMPLTTTIKLLVYYCESETPRVSYLATEITFVNMITWVTVLTFSVKPMTESVHPGVWIARPLVHMSVCLVLQQLNTWERLKSVRMFVRGSDHFASTASFLLKVGRFLFPFFLRDLNIG